MKILSSFNNLNVKFWSRVVASVGADAKSLSVFRILAGLFLLCLSFYNFVWIGDMPQAFFDPPPLSIVNFFNGFPATGFFFGAHLLLIVTAVCIILGIRARIFSVVYGITGIVIFNFYYSFGKIGHSAALYLMMLIIMSFSDLGQYLALVPDKPARKDNNARCLSLLSVILCFAFFTAGIEKALNWINIDFNKNGSGAWFYNQFNFMRQYLLAPYIGTHLPFWCFKLMDYCAVVFELSPIFFLLHSRRAWHLWLAVACFFHLANAVVFNINFMSFAVLYLAFANYNQVFNTLTAWFKKPSFKAISGILLTVVVAVRIYYLSSGINAPNIFLPDSKELSLYFSLVFWVIVICFLIKKRLL